MALAQLSASTLCFPVLGFCVGTALSRGELFHQPLRAPVTVPQHQNPCAVESRALPVFLPAASPADGLSGAVRFTGMCSSSSPSWQRFQHAEPDASLLVSRQAVLSRDLSVPVRVPTLALEEDSLALLLQTLLPSRGSPVAVQTATAPLLLGESLSQDMGGYCANGFGPDCHEESDPSCTHAQLGHALGSWDSPQVEEDGVACDRDAVLEQPLLVGLTGDSYTRERDYRTSETWLSLHLQLCSKCQCPARGAGSCLPLPTPDRTFSQEDLQESRGVAEHQVPLSSVKLQASVEEDRGQLVLALRHGCGTEPQPGVSTAWQDDLELAALGVPSPCQLPQLLPSIPWAAAFSGYEPRPPADSEL